MMLSDRLIAAPATVGGYYIGGKYGIGFLLTQRPAWWHRMMMRFFLGWEWRDAE